MLHLIERTHEVVQQFKTDGIALLGTIQSDGRDLIRVRELEGVVVSHASFISCTSQLFPRKTSAQNRAASEWAPARPAAPTPRARVPSGCYPPFHPAQRGIHPNRRVPNRSGGTRHRKRLKPCRRPARACCAGVRPLR